MKIKAIIYDSDGTLVDTTQLVIEGFKKVLVDFNHSEFANDKNVTKNIGGHIPDVFSNIIGVDKSSEIIQKMTTHLDNVQDSLALKTSLDNVSN